MHLLISFQETRHLSISIINMNT